MFKSYMIADKSGNIILESNLDHNKRKRRIRYYGEASDSKYSKKKSAG